jgi:3-oxoacyl-[acyl-carrier-protein] synthase-3
MATKIALNLVHSKTSINLLMSGFGVGWRWSSAAWRTEPLHLCEMMIFN